MKRTPREALKTDNAVQLGLAIHRLRARMRAEGEATASASGSNLSQLSLLARIVERGPLTANALARCEHLRPQSAAATVAALKTDGFVRAVPDPADGRKVLLSATPAGRAAVEAAVAARAVWLRRAVAAAVGPGETDELRRVIDLLNRLADCDTGSAERDRR